MANLHTWSMGVGRWLGVPVRIHMLLILFVVALFGTEWNYNGGATSFFTGTCNCHHPSAPCQLIAP